MTEIISIYGPTIQIKWCVQITTMPRKLGVFEKNRLFIRNLQAGEKQTKLKHIYEYCISYESNIRVLNAVWRIKFFSTPDISKIHDFPKKLTKTR